MSTKDAISKLKRIALNRIRLDSCSQHKFEDVKWTSNGPNPKDLICNRCKGQMSIIGVNEYVRGFASAGGNPEDILPKFFSANEGMQVRCPKCAVDTDSECELCEGTSYIEVDKARKYLKIS